MKTVLKVISLLMFCGALFVGCGSSNNSNGASCSTNGVNGTYVNSVCSLSNGISGQCSNPSYPYYLASVPDPQMGGQAIPACCNQPSLVQGIVCTPATTGVTGSSQCAQYGPQYYWNGYQCVP